MADDTPPHADTPPHTPTPEAELGYPTQDQAEQLSLFRKMVGLPDEAQDFSIARPESMPEDLWNATMAQDLAQLAYQYGVPAPAMQALTAAYADHAMQAHQASEQSLLTAQQEALATLESAWGGNLDANLDDAQSTLLTLAKQAGIDATPLMQDPHIGNNAPLLHILYQASKSITEAPLKTPAPHSAAPSDEARRMEKDPTHPLHLAYMNSAHPDHKYANALYDKLAGI